MGDDVVGAVLQLRHTILPDNDPLYCPYCCSLASSEDRIGRASAKAQTDEVEHDDYVLGVYVNEGVCTRCRERSQLLG